MDDRRRLLDALEIQRAGCEQVSPLYGRLLATVIADVHAGGPCWPLLSDMSPDPIAEAFVLRFMGGVHRLVLEGNAPALAAYFPTTGGAFDPDRDDPSAVFLETVVAHHDALAAALHRPVQTNEVGRCAAMLPAFLHVARETGLPLRMLEIGASGGLNLRWDQYRYEGGADGTAFGDPASPVRFDTYRDPRPDVSGDATVIERRGCDRRPIDPSTPDGQLTLRSFVWPDQAVRHAQLDAALEVAARVPAVVDEADAGEWVAAALATPRPGCASVVYHSIVWQYLAPGTQGTALAAIQAAGAAATPGAPVAWVRFEPAPDPTAGVDVDVRLWPGGQRRALVRSGYHGKPVRVSPEPGSG